MTLASKKTAVIAVLASLVALFRFFGTAGAQMTDRAFFYIEIHTEAIIKSRADFDIETELLKRLAAILDKHRAKGSFMFLDIYPRMVKTYNAGPVNQITDLEKGGHEIGVHFHPWGPEFITIASTLHDIKNSGTRDVQSLTTSFHQYAVVDAEKRSFDVQKKEAQLFRMLDDAYAGGITSSFRWCMDETSPYRPGRDNWVTADWSDCRNDKKVSDPNGRMIAVGMYDQGGYTFTEQDDSFRDILRRIEQVVPRFKKGRVNYYPVAIHDYFFLNPSGERAVNRIVTINEERLKAFDQFLSAIDDYIARGYFQYATRRDVTTAFEQWERSQGRGPVRTPRVNVFYIIHVHSGADRRPEMAPLSGSEFDGTVAAIVKIADVLEAHSAVGTFHVMQNFADAVVRFQGVDNNILKDLEKRGHEVGAHVHTDLFNQWQNTREAIIRAGIPEVYTLSGVKRTRLSGNEAFKRVADLGFKVATGNNSPLDPLPMDGFKDSGIWGFEKNQAYRSAGAFLYPWMPDYEKHSISTHNPNGKVLYLDAVPPNLWMGAGSLDDAAFGRLRKYFDSAVAASSGDRMAAWGFVTHETEYQSEHGLFEPSNPPHDAALKALDDFLKFIDKMGGNIAWSTPKKIYLESKTWNKN